MPGYKKLNANDSYSVFFGDNNTTFNNDNDSSGVCEAVCSQECINGYCLEPDICDCNPGYDFNEDGICEPVCIPGCINGICSQPDNCLCLPGYEMIQTEWTQCQLICDCVHGNCTENKTCLCDNGWYGSDCNSTAAEDFVSVIKISHVHR